MGRPSASLGDVEVGADGSDRRERSEKRRDDADLARLSRRQRRCSVAVFGAQYIVAQWDAAGHRRRLGPNHVVLEATGPSKNGFRTVVTVFSNGSVMVPFGSYAGQNTGIAIDSLTSDQFRKRADALFGFKGSERQARTQPAWLTPDNARRLLEFSQTVASEYAKALTASPGLPQEVVQAGGQPTATVVNPARANPDLSETPLEPAPVSSA